MKTFGNTAHCIDHSSSYWTTEERGFRQKIVKISKESQWAVTLPGRRERANRHDSEAKGHFAVTGGY